MLEPLPERVKIDFSIYRTPSEQLVAPVETLDHQTILDILKIYLRTAYGYQEMSERQVSRLTLGAPHHIEQWLQGWRPGSCGLELRLGNTFSSNGKLYGSRYDGQITFSCSGDDQSWGEGDLRSPKIVNEFTAALNEYLTKRKIGVRSRALCSWRVARIDAEIPDGLSQDSLQ